MKNINPYIPTIIGIVNMIFVIISVFYFSLTDYNKIPNTLYVIFETYLRFSSMPALISIVLTKFHAQPKYAVFNYIVNVTFLSIYVLLYF